MTLRQRLIARSYLDASGKLTPVGNAYVADLIEQLRGRDGGDGGAVLGCGSPMREHRRP